MSKLSRMALVVFWIGMLGVGRVSFAAVDPDDFANTPATSGTLTIGSGINGTIERMVDRDCFALVAEPGRTYTIRVTPIGGGQVKHAEWRLIDTDQQTVLLKKHSVNLAFAEATWSGSSVAKTVYVDVRGFAEYTTGTYQLLVTQSAVPDSDGDGLPNAWESSFGLNPNISTGIHGAAGDFDSDGFSNEEEFQMGTAPNNANSGLEVQVVIPGAATHQIQWAAIQGATYEIQFTTAINGTPQVWTPLGTITHQGVSGTASFTDLAPGALPRCYRVRFVSVLP
jgi:hypothetical protein